MPGAPVMTQVEALRLLGLSPGCSPDQVEQAYKAAMQQQLTCARFAPAGPPRDAANAAVTALSDAYAALAGNLPRTQATAPSAGSTAGRRTPLNTPPAPLPRTPSPISPPVPRAPAASPLDWIKHLSAGCRRLFTMGTGVGGAILSFLAPLRTVNASGRSAQVTAAAIFIALLLCSIPVTRWMTSRGTGITASTPSTVVTTVVIPHDGRPVPSRAAGPYPAPTVASGIVAPRAPTAIPQAEKPVRQPLQPTPLISDGPGSAAMVTAPPAHSDGWLVVKSTPWARVEVDGAVLDDAPWLVPKPLPARVYTIVLTAESGKRLIRQLEIRSGQTAVVTWLVKRNQFTVTYEASP